ncbi:MULTISPECIES: cytochrome b/b6 domain-containing protein [Ruegeria]|uniref:Cytochrome B n=1 Tax=Ruegeria atlantica TaxID=81569 RepID=A0AA91C0R1_9RHOB|nr:MULTISPECIES: cytochrome b/b6 domain-containing protein [Ruegeria]NOE20426.1 cytochrome B [Ruegeria atlantica]QFT75668.1 putative Ni/Fe-hydrogenase B-type cytochrome subunit [Ruegeria sp. THAF33]
MREVPAPFDGLAYDGHLVWDRFTRVFHWGLVACVSTALVSGFLLDASWIRLHLVSGSLAIALVTARTVWGFTGPTYARFSQFLPSYRQVISHLRAGAAHARHIGHNPLAALMVFVLLTLIVGLGLTGVASLGSGLKSGPMAASLPASQGHIWSKIHELAAFALLSFIALHIGGVVLESRRSRENLARSMITGRKEMRAGDLTAPPRPAQRALAALFISGLVIIATGAINRMSQSPLPLPPVGSMALVYSDECAACHMAYHPSLRPAASWQLMMDKLDSHFGEDATLPKETGDEITVWLVKHSAETVDSKPATLWTGLQETLPVALPNTDIWQRLHGSLADGTFTRRTIHSRSNCFACHRDAESGWFSPFQISVPKEPKQ